MSGNSSIMTITCPPVPLIDCESGAPPVKVYDQDQCCYHYECQYCTGPDGTPKQAGDSWISNCKECLCTKTFNVTCKDVICEMPEEPLCNKEGFESIDVATPNNTCCPTKECRCNPYLCRPPLDNCDLGFQLNESFQEGDCCANYSCVPKDVCVVNGTAYPPLSPVPADKGSCSRCQCTAEKDQVSHLNMVRCDSIACITDCEVGYTHVKEDGECCGSCVKVACVMNKEDGTQEIHQPGDIWSVPGENCTLYRCEQAGTAFTLVVEKTICSPLEPEICPPAAIQMTPDGCCQTCQVNVTKTCSLSTMTINATSGLCSGIIDVGYCSGPCMGTSMYEQTKQMMSHTCSCCIEVETTTKVAMLECLGGSFVNYSYDSVAQCGCATVACIT